MAIQPTPGSPAPPPATGAGLPPPWPLLVTPDDFLIATVRSSLAGAVLHIAARLWLPNGLIAPYEQVIRPGSARALQNFSQQLHHGYLVSASVTALSPFPTRGQVLAALQIARPPVATFTPNWFLGQDYLTSMDAVYWPGGRNTPGVEGPGVLQSLAIANPAAGADWSQSVPTAARWLVRGGAATLVTSVAVATRQVALVIDDGVNTLFTIEAGTTQLASLTQVYSLLPGQTTATLISTQLPIYIPPDLRLFAGWRIRTSTGAIQVTDQWSAIRLLIEENLED